MSLSPQGTIPTKKNSPPYSSAERVYESMPLEGVSQKSETDNICPASTFKEYSQDCFDQYSVKVSLFSCQEIDKRFSNRTLFQRSRIYTLGSTSKQDTFIELCGINLFKRDHNSNQAVILEPWPGNDRDIYIKTLDFLGRKNHYRFNPLTGGLRELFDSSTETGNKRSFSQSSHRPADECRYTEGAERHLKDFQ